MSIALRYTKNISGSPPHILKEITTEIEQKFSVKHFNDSSSYMIFQFWIKRKKTFTSTLLFFLYAWAEETKKLHYQYLFEMTIINLFDYSSAVRGYNYYRRYWQPQPEQRLVCCHEKNNPYDFFGIKVTVLESGQLGTYLWKIHGLPW